VFVGFLGSLKDSQSSGLQVLYAVEEGVCPLGLLCIPGKGEQGREVLADVVPDGLLPHPVLRRYAALGLRMNDYGVLNFSPVRMATDCAHSGHWPGVNPPPTRQRARNPKR
jgi:hypothetical protein